MKNYVAKKGFCLICYKSLNNSNSLKSILSFNNIICTSCQKQFKVLNLITTINGIETWFIYEYDAFLKKLIYQYKGCYDIVLKDVFFNQYKKEIKNKYKNYVIVYPPSSKNDDNKRGYKHIEMMIECLHMKHLNLFYKKGDYKQSSHYYKDRQQVENIIDIIDKNFNFKQKFLIIDDIYTSGSTLKTIINLLVKYKVKKENIKAVILAKTANIVEL